MFSKITHFFSDFFHKKKENSPSEFQKVLNKAKLDNPPLLPPLPELPKLDKDLPPLPKIEKELPPLPKMDNLKIPSPPMKKDRILPPFPE